MYLCRISAGMAHFLIVIKEPCDNCFRCRCQNNLSSDKFLVSPCCKYFQLPQKVSSASCPNPPPSKKFSSASHLPPPHIEYWFSMFGLCTVGIQDKVCTQLYNSNYSCEMLNPTHGWAQVCVLYIHNISTMIKNVNVSSKQPHKVTVSSMHF